MKCYNKECALFDITKQNNCYLHLDNQDTHSDTCGNFIGEDKEMDKIQMTEEQANNILNYVYGSFNRTATMKRFKEQGFIKKSNLEIAHENYYNSLSTTFKQGRAINYIDELEKEVERLKSLDK